MKSLHSDTWSLKVHRQPMWTCKDHGEPKGSIEYSFSTQDEFQRHMLIQHHKTMPSDAEIMEVAVEQPILGGIPPLDLCPLCLFPGQNPIHMEAKLVEQNQPGSSSTELGKSDNNLSHKKKTRVRFTDDIELPLDDTCSLNSEPDHDSEDAPSTPFVLGLHVAAHLQYLMVLSLRFAATSSYKNEVDEDGNSFRSVSVVGSSLSKEETHNDQESSDGDSNYSEPYFPEDDLTILEEARLKLEGDQRSNPSLLPNIAEDQEWHRFWQEPPVQDDILENMMKYKRSPKNLETFRVRGIPLDWTRDDLQACLAAKAPEWDLGTIVRSLSQEIDGCSFTATVTFDNIPHQLQALEAQESWYLDPAAPTAQDQQQSLALDKAFIGVTTLYDPPLKDHKIE